MSGLKDMTDGSCLQLGDSVTLLESARHDIYSLCSHVHQFAFDIVFAPLKLHLADVPTMPVSRILMFSFYHPSAVAMLWFCIATANPLLQAATVDRTTFSKIKLPLIDSPRTLVF